MKAKYAEWAKLGPKAKPKAITRLDSLPGIKELEADRILLNRLHGAGEEAFDLRCDAVSLKHFGITKGDTLFPYPDRYWELEAEEYYKVFERERQHERRFATSTMTEPEALAHLKTWGWDLTDDQGRPLLVTPYFIRQVEAVAKGIAGHGPDAAAIDNESWEATMEADKRRFLAAKRSGPK